MPTNLGTLAWLVVLPVLALAPAFAGSSTREAVPAAPTPSPILSNAAVVSALEFVANSLLPPIYFAAGTTQIRPSDTKILDAHAVWLRRDRKRVLLIEGHTDGPGDSPFSREVGEQRAQSAKAYLVSKGALADHIVISSRGGGLPACKEKTAPCRAINRRATFSTAALP
jgi:peptidoglycan-associated lipoprotein